MPAWRFHLLTIDHEMVEGGFIVTTTTNAACHLYLRYSNVFPRIHRKSIARRGLVMGWDARYCFTVYQHIEQNEEGDTLTHTFTWPGWVNCNTRYFYFWGTMFGLEMVSDSPIFWLHYLWEVPPEPLLKEYHDSPLLAIRDIAGGSEVAQSFTPQENYAVLKLDLPLWKTEPAYNGTIHIQIRTNDVNHPSETILWETTISASDLPPAAYTWFTFAVSGVSAEAGVPLWIVLIWEDVLYSFWPPYCMSDTGDLYPRGETLSRLAAGIWSGYGLGNDLGFRTWGL